MRKRTNRARKLAKRRRSCRDKLQQIRKMDDDLSELLDLADLGRRDAAAQVRPEQLPAAFDLAKPAT
jgi:hypothetical protein